MRAFARLLDRLSLTQGRNAKLVLVRDFLKQTPDPDRGWALASLTGALTFDAAKPAAIRKAIEGRMDPVLFGWSYDFVGDLAETVALVWPAKPGANREPELSEVVDALRTASRSEVQGLIEGWLDALDADGRWALLKLLTGGLRVGLSARLAKQAAADIAKIDGAGVDVAEVEEVWHVLEPPYEDLFAWLEGRAERPSPDAPGRFRPVMLAQAMDEDVDFARLDPADYAAEWKWDGIRVQAVSERGQTRLWSRTGEDVSAAFPDVVAALDFEGVIDGELLVLREGRVAPFGDLQQRLNRKSADAKLMAAYPAGIRAYDLLLDGETDLRHLPFRERRARLEAFVGAIASPRIDLSPTQPFATWDAAGRPARRTAGGRSALRRRADAEALGLDLRGGAAERALVQVEARPAPDRRGADVRPARPRQALQLLLRLHLRGLAGGRGGGAQPHAGRQGLFRLHRRGAEAARQVRARQHHRTLRPGPLGARRP